MKEDLLEAVEDQTVKTTFEQDNTQPKLGEISGSRCADG